MSDICKSLNWAMFTDTQPPNNIPSDLTCAPSLTPSPSPDHQQRLQDMQANVSHLATSEHVLAKFHATPHGGRPGAVLDPDTP